jgi:hypothetical protein
MGMDPTSSRSIYTHRLCGLIVRLHASIRWRQQDYCRQSTFILWSLAFCSSILGRSCFRLLCLLPRDNKEMEDLPHDSDWAHVVIYDR